MSAVFSNNLKKFRQQKNLTQERVAELLGVNAHTISRWECNTTLPDVTMLPAIARVYCVTVDDLFRETSVAYENYAQRAASIYEATRAPEDFIRADMEFKKQIQTGGYSTEDLRLYGILHQYMMQYCLDKAIALFDKVIEKGVDADEEVFWRTKHQKMRLYAQIGRSQESIDSTLKIIEQGSQDPEDWICLIAAYSYSGNEQKAYEWFQKAIRKFPDKSALYVYGGDTCKNLGRYDEAFSHWNKALEMDNTFHDAKYSQIFYYEEKGEYEKAYKLWREIIEELKNEGYDIEAAAEEKRAQACLEKMNR